MSDTMHDGAGAPDELAIPWIDDTMQQRIDVARR